jgi:hypothetical protein
VGPGASRLAPGSLLAAGVSSLLHDNTVGKTPAPGPLLGVSIRQQRKGPGPAEAMKNSACSSDCPVIAARQQPAADHAAAAAGRDAGEVAEASAVVAVAARAR